MSFLTSGLGQPWYSSSNTVAGLLSMQELTNPLNFEFDPPGFPANAGVSFPKRSKHASTGLFGMGTLVDQAAPNYAENEGATLFRSHGRRVGPPQGRARGGRRVGRRQDPRGTVALSRCVNEQAAAKAAKIQLRDCRRQAMSQAGLTNKSHTSTSASEAQVLSGLGATPDAAQGTWLAPGQTKDPLAAAKLVAQQRAYEAQREARRIRARRRGGLGATPDAAQGTWLAPSEAANVLKANRLIAQQRAYDARQEGRRVRARRRGGLGQGDAAQGTYLSPSQAANVESASQLVAQNRGMGQFNYVDPSGLVKSAFVRGKSMDLSPICDPATGTCLSYPTQAEVNKAIGAKVEGQSALHQSRIQLPSIYQHPTLGPWGVDPRSAYQYWWAQQAAMQQAAQASPLSIWGSPGFVSPTAPLPPSTVAQTDAYNPFSHTWPQAGAAIEHF